MKARIAVVLSMSLVVFALPALAHAALPKPKSDLIVPAKSLGGVALGGSPTAVTKAWGATKECEFQCLYEGPEVSGGTASLGSVLLEAKSTGATPKVWMITITVAEKEVGSKLVPDFNTPLSALKTSKGIGLGSKGSELAQAYHAAKKESVGGGVSLYTIKGPKESATVFTVGAAGKVTTITIYAHPGG